MRLDGWTCGRRAAAGLAGVSQSAQLLAPPTAAQVQAALRPDEALLEYVRYAPIDVRADKRQAPQYGVFVVRGGAEPVQAIPLGDAAAIDDLVSTFRDGVVADLAQVEKVYPAPTEWRRAGTGDARTSGGRIRAGVGAAGRGAGRRAARVCGARWPARAAAV
jgi:hypothetical protein